MSTYEAAYESLLQGVSQQLPEERLPGQVTAQNNMVADPVTNLRRRPGVIYKKAWAWAGADATHARAWFTDIAGQRVHILLNTNDGNVRILNESFVELANLAGGAYLTAAAPNSIRATSVGNEFFLGNTAKLPVIGYTPGVADPRLSGFFYIVSGAFSKNYNITVVWSGGSKNATYTTPNGATAGDAALATPEYIAEQLRAALATDTALTVSIAGPYVYVQRAINISVETTVGTAYLIASKSGVVAQAGDLPARLPAVANNFICRVGTGKSPQYYVYVHANTEWNETAKWGSPTSITNVPVSIVWSGTAFVLNAAAFDGRFAGDDDSNQQHEWMQQGITGMSTFQGRLVLLSGPLVSLSASGYPRRFFRSTVAGVLPGDTIEVGSSMNSSAAYEWAIPFQKDLLLFSRAYQAVLPSGNQAVTPLTATVMPTSSHEVDTTSGPITLGRSLMYSSPRSADFFGAMEMVPSPYTDSQYLSQDSTPHLPKYLAGRCRFAVASSVASLALFAPSGDTYSLVVHEYHWDGDKKVQQAWHMWTFLYPVAEAYFASAAIVLLFVKNGQVVMGTIDTRAGSVNATSERRPFLDLNVSLDIVNHVVTLPAWMLAFDPAISSKVKLVVLTGGLAGEQVGFTVAPNGLTLTTVLSHPSGRVGLGIPYYSGVIPAPPVVKDYNAGVINTGKATLQRFMISTKNSAEFKVAVSDNRSAADTSDMPTLAFSSADLQLGRGLYADVAVSIVPCRTDLRSTMMEVYTEDTGELNITSLEYVAKYHPKIKRR